MPEEPEPTVYLTFDDGPHPEITPFVLQQLEQYNAKACFFCIGKNVADHPDVYKGILEQGHTTGNHTFNHMNGWKTDTESYIRDILAAEKLIENRIFRPPYGRIRMTQAKLLANAQPSWKIYMWDVLSGDFDIRISPEQCLKNVIMHTRPGAIVVFHDSEKARERMQYVLPRFLAFCQEQKWALKSLPV